MHGLMRNQVGNLDSTGSMAWSRIEKHLHCAAVSRRKLPVRRIASCGLRTVCCPGVLCPLHCHIVERLLQLKDCCSRQSEACGISAVESTRIYTGCLTRIHFWLRRESRRPAVDKSPASNCQSPTSHNLCRERQFPLPSLIVAASRGSAQQKFILFISSSRMCGNRQSVPRPRYMLH